MALENSEGETYGKTASFVFNVFTVEPQPTAGEDASSNKVASSNVLGQALIEVLAWFMVSLFHTVVVSKGEQHLLYTDWIHGEPITYWCTRQ